jgi:hypothetical protein
MDSEERRVLGSERRLFHPADSAAVLYLVAPLFLFFAFFVRVEVAVPACILIASLTFELSRRTAWRDFRADQQSAYFLFIAAVWVWLSGGVGPLSLSQNADWAKHNLIITLLAHHSWPPRIDLPHFGHLSLRYYVGWHLVPALIVKLTHAQSPNVAASIWTTLGLFLFFNLLPKIVGRRSAAIAAPIVFVFFGGADIIGTQITQYADDTLFHFEWWVGWAQFSSNTTAIFWSPQQALPAWLAIGVLMRCRGSLEFLPYCALLASATLLWSPFATIGLAPFVLILLIKHGPLQIALGWRPILSFLLLALPVFLYLASGISAIPHGFIWTVSCTEQPCFTWAGYVLFLVIEVGVPLVVLFARAEPEGGFLITAAITLCLIPLYKIGMWNDFAMRASLPSLAILAILCAKLVGAPRPWPTTALVIVLLALPSVTGELVRGFLVPAPEPIDLDSADDSARWWLDQTFVPSPIWVLR